MRGPIAKRFLAFEFGGRLNGVEGTGCICVGNGETRDDAAGGGVANAEAKSAGIGCETCRGGKRWIGRCRCGSSKAI
jgi:hypothetical protein